MTKPWLVLIAGALAFAPLGAPAAPLKLAPSGAVGLSSLSLAARLKDAPDTTIVRAGKGTSTLGQLRAAHRARVAALTRARATGIQISGDLGASHSGTVRATTPVVSNGSRIAGATATLSAVTEPASDYASSPADMRAFCAGAQASACAFLPPQQFLWAEGPILMDVDPLVDQDECTSQGGIWANMGFYGDGGVECAYSYPQSVVVHFTPGPTYNAASSNKCDTSTWKMTVDKRGAIGLQYIGAGDGQVQTGDNPTCVVSVTPS